MLQVPRRFSPVFSTATATFLQNVKYFYKIVYLYMSVSRNIAKSHIRTMINRKYTGNDILLATSG